MSRSRILSMITLGCLVFVGLAVVPAWSQTVTMTQPLPTLAASQTSGGIPAVPAAPSPTEATPQVNVLIDRSGSQENSENGYLFNSSRLGAGLGQALASDGIYLKGGSQQIVNGLVSGGIKQAGVYNSGFSALGFDVDLQQAVGLPNSAFHFLASFANGVGGSYYAGSHLDDVLGWAYSDGVRLEELSYEQLLDDRQVRVLAGRISPMWDFTQIDHFSCQFTAMACPAPRAYLFNSQRETYEVGTWGALLQAAFFNQIGYGKVGAYENEPILASHQGNQLGWPGTDWGLNEAHGVFVPFEIGYKTNIRDERYPSGGFIGGWLDTATVTDYLTNQQGTSAILHGGSRAEHRDLTGAYVGWQKLVYRNDRTTDRGITFITQFQWDTSGGDEYVAWDGMVGMLGIGPFRSRPNDQWAVAVTYNQIDPRVVEAEDQTLSKNHIYGRMSNGEPSFLVQYGIAFAPGVMARPFAEWTLHPDQLTSPVPDPNVTHSVTVGLNVLLNFNDMFGLPRLGRCPVACGVPSSW